MLKTILLILLSINIYALEISLNSGKENHKPFSVMHLKHSDRFACEEIKDDFKNVVKVVCAFSRSPSQELKKMQNNFFQIDIQVKKKIFFLIIKPYKKIKLYPMVFDLTKEDTLFSANIELANHWMIIGYEDTIPFMEQNNYQDVAINFPFSLDKEMLPYVGSLDIKGRPVHIKRVGDVTEYIKIKKLYEEKNYDTALSLTDDIIKDYPNSLFMAELLYYKIKIYAQMKDSEKVIEVANSYLINYSYDENVAEVLSLLAKAYSDNGLNTDSDYFFDRLFSEHYDSIYAKWGFIYMAQSLESSGSASKAIELYEKAIDETDNVDLAVVAAYKLAQNYMGASNYKKAAEYIEKIVAAKPEYFLENLNESVDMMYGFTDNSDYAHGAMIAKALIKDMKHAEDDYEILLRESGIWLSKTQSKKEALEYLNKYMSAFPDGRFIDEVKVAKDALFFDVSDENASEKLVNYEKLMQEYMGDNIANRAVYEKAKLLVKEGMYIQALDLEEALLKLDENEYKEKQQIISDAAIGTMKKALEAKECAKVLTISSKYHIELSKEWDDGIYECAMKGADFALAKKMADKNLKSTELNERKKWLYRFIKVDFATGNYSNVLEASKELISLIEKDKDSEYKDIYRYIFDTYHRLEKSDKMITAIEDIQKIYQDDYKDIDRYVSIIAVGSEKRDNNLIIKYAKKVMELQKLSETKSQSPFVEFTLYQAYIEIKNNNEALEIIQSLEKIALTNTQKARQKYLLGNVLAKLWRDEEAKKAYQDAIEADKDSAWAKLAQSAKELL